MNIRDQIRKLDIYVFLAVMISSLMAAIYSLSRFISTGKGIGVGLSQSIIFSTGNLQNTILFSGVAFIALLMISISLSFSNLSHVEIKGIGTSYSEFFTLTFFILMLISVATPSPSVSLKSYLGSVGLALYTEQITLFFIAITAVVGLICFLPLSLSLDQSPKKALLQGFSTKGIYWLYGLIPASVSTLVLTVGINLGITLTLLYFLLFLSIFVFMQINGLLKSISSLFLILGSQIILVNFTAITSSIYLIFSIILIALGFMLFSFPHRSFRPANKNSGNHDTEDESPNQDNLSNPSVSNLKLRDSREIHETLFIRGTCINCDSVEFYRKVDGLECKKCKTLNSSHERHFNSFNVAEGRLGAR